MPRVLYLEFLRLLLPRVPSTFFPHGIAQKSSSSAVAFGMSPIILVPCLEGIFKLPHTPISMALVAWLAGDGFSSLTARLLYLLLCLDTLCFPGYHQLRSLGG